MELKPGYKQTEVGMIPEDWEISPLEAFTSFISYGFTNPMPSVESGIYMITAKDINEGKIQFDTARCTTEEAYRTLLTAKSRPQKGDLLLTKDGTLGRLALVDERTICINQSVAILRLNTRAVAEFLKILLEAPVYQRRMLEDAGGSTIKHIYITIVNRMPLAVPPTKAEQEAIAEALGDAAALITALEQLIAKKRHIKQGTMQELLTGQRRSPDFDKQTSYKQTVVGLIPEDWNAVPILEMCDEKDDSIKIGPFGSQLKKEYLVESGYKVYGQENVYAQDMEIGNRYLTKEHFMKLKSCELLPGDFIVSMMGTIGQCMIVPDGIQQGVIDSHLIRVRLDSKIVDAKYLSYYYSSKLVYYQISRLSVGGIMAGLSSSIVKQLFIGLPSTTAEQTAIATILSDMDAEITALETKLHKTRLLKQGMMQELLTGRIRLVGETA